MNFRALILPLFLAGGLGSVYVLPQAGDVAQSAIDMTLPETVGRWQLATIPATQAEIDILSKDTKFAKAVCNCPRLGEYTLADDFIYDRADLSIVLSGYDLNNSLHRPERCMPAQGHHILSAKTVPLTLANGRTFAIRRLRSIQEIINPETRKKDRQFDCVTYYFFVGHDRIEYDPTQRTLIDMKDRLLRGMDQRWAYVTVSMWFGKMPWLDKPITEAEADQKLLGLLTGLAEKQINWEQIR